MKQQHKKHDNPIIFIQQYYKPIPPKRNSQVMIRPKNKLPEIKTPPNELKSIEMKKEKFENSKLKKIYTNRRFCKTTKSTTFSPEFDNKRFSEHQRNTLLPSITFDQA
jgi:hypothetical protein